MMLRLRLQANATNVGWLDICNTGTGTEELGNYAVCLRDQHLQALRSGTLEGYPRRFGAWELVRRALGTLASAEETDGLSH